MLLAQNMTIESSINELKKIPESSKGQRVILDQRVAETKVEPKPVVIPKSVYYWSGVIALLVIAVVAAAHYLASEKKAQIKKQAKQ